MMHWFLQTKDDVNFTKILVNTASDELLLEKEDVYDYGSSGRSITSRKYFRHVCNGGEIIYYSIYENTGFHGSCASSFSLNSLGVIINEVLNDADKFKFVSKEARRLAEMVKEKK